MLYIRAAMAKKPKVISLYTGAGGLDYGFEAAGFDTAVAIEMDRDACNTLRRNRPEWAVIERSIYDVPSEEILAAGKLKRGEVDVLIGGPPCQPFSKAAYWARGDTLRLSDPRASTLGAYMRVVEDTLPKAFLLENVEGISFAGKSEGLRLLLDRIRDINRSQGTSYEPQFAVLRAVEYGVPQDRVRFFLVAARDGSRFEFPKARFGEGLEPYRTAWDAIGDLGNPPRGEDLAMRGKWAALLPTIPEGENYLFHTDRGGGEPLFGWRRRYWSFLLKLAKNRPSWTIQAQPGPAIGPFHWDNRRLSMRELCRLQTFPDDVVITGSRIAVQRQVGNAVPSLLAETLAREIRVQFLGAKRTKGDPKLLPAKLLPVPKPRKPKPVPKEFLVLRGKHAAHPGTGMGNRAVASQLAMDFEAAE